MSSGILHVIHSSLRWQDAPAERGPHMTIYNWFLRLSRLGVFNRIFAGWLGRRDGPTP